MFDVCIVNDVLEDAYGKLKDVLLEVSRVGVVRWCKGVSRVGMEVIHYNRRLSPELWLNYWVRNQTS